MNKNTLILFVKFFFDVLLLIKEEFFYLSKDLKNIYFIIMKKDK